MLVAGGINIDGSSSISNAELYDPAIGTWTATGSLTARSFHSATLLPNGKVLVAGGWGSSGRLASAQLYDPVAGTWAVTGSLVTAHDSCTATLLPNGKVLVEGGYGTGYLAIAELYDPATGTWAPTNSLATARSDHTATLLRNGKVLVAGGYKTPTGPLASTEFYDTGLGFSGASQPVIGSASLDASGKLVLTGTGFLGLSTGSSGNGGQDSPTNHPVLQLRRLDNEQCTFLSYDPSVNVSATSVRSLPVAAFSGYALATVFTNGIPSTSAVVSFADIALEAPTGTPVNNGSGTLACVTVTGQTKDLNITVRNTGSSALTAIAASISGPDAGLFTLFTAPPTSLAAGASAAFILRFSPTSSGVKTATLSIASGDPDENPFTLALTGIMLSFTVDGDGDGMNDAAESLLSALGFDWQVNQAALVNTLNANANTANLYNPTQVQALNVGVPLLTKDPATDKFKLTLGVQKSPNLTAPFLAFPMNGPGTATTINAAGKLEFEFTSPDNAAFFRVEAK